MPHIFQKEIEKDHPYLSGCEKFDSLYQLYTVFKNPSYFLVNIFFGASEVLLKADVELFLESVTEEYKISNYVVRCEKNVETKPIQAIAFSDITSGINLKKCAEYICDRLTQGYNCIVHEVITGKYPSNRLEWLYSFGIWFKNSLPQIEIYPATDASSIKWGKLSPLDLISADREFNFLHTKIRDEQSIEDYQKIKIGEWVEQFKNEIDRNFDKKDNYTNPAKLFHELKQSNHPIFNFQLVDLCIEKTKKELVDIALKCSSFLYENNVNPNQVIIHGSLLYNYRIIIWDISTNKRWQYLK